MSSLDAYVNLSSFLQMPFFKYKLCTLWLRNHRCPVMSDGGKGRWMDKEKATDLHLEGLLGIWCLPALWTMP